LLEKDIERPAAKRYRFGPFVLDPAQRRLTRNGTPESLTPKVFDLLVLFIENAGKLLTKDEILDRLWDGADFYESTLTSHVSMLRQALGETKEFRYIETVTKKGYRFIGQVESVSDESQAVSAPATAIQPVARGKWFFWATAVLAIIVSVAASITLWHRKPPPTPPEVRLYREAIETERQGNDGLALQKLGEALRIRPEFDEANLKAAWICYDDNDNEKASNYVNAVLGRKGQIVDSVRLQAEALALLLQGGQDEAFNKLQLAAEAAPTNTDGLYALAETAVGLHLFDQADAALQQCKAVDSKNPLCAFETVSLRVYQNRFADAISEYQGIGKSGVNFPWLDEPAGYAALAQGDLDGALRHFHSLEEAGRTFASSVHFRASQEGVAAVALYQGKLQDAHQQIVDALETSNSSYDRASYHLSLAHMDALHNRSAEATSDVNAAIRESDAPDIALSSARALAMAGDFDSASALLAKYAGASATLGKQYLAAGRFVAGLKAMSRRKWDKAIEALRSSNRYDFDPETAYYLARAQTSALQWNDAAGTLKELLSMEGKILMDSVASLTPLARRDLATCYERLGNRSEAESLLQAARSQWEHADPELRNALK